jgi:gliding motility-associated-like protein
MRKPLLLLSVVSVFFTPATRLIEKAGQMVYNNQGDVVTKRNNAVFNDNVSNGAFLISSFTGLNNGNIVALKVPTTRHAGKVKPATASPDIIISEASGVISACAGSPSTSTQQFTVSGIDLTDNITVMAPAGFEISINPAGGFTNAFFLVTQGSMVTPKIVYVRAAAAGTPANLSGTVTLTSAGAVTKKVDVKGTIYAPPVVDHIADLTFMNGDVTTPVNFTGTGNTFYWTNDKPAVGLAASGQDNIPSFTAVNPGSSPAIAHISVTSQKANIVYMPDYASNMVLAINTINNKVIANIPVGANPGFVAISPDGKKAYVANVSGRSLSIINTQTNQVKDISIFDNPTALVFSADGTRAYVAGESGECTVIDVANDAVLTALTFPSGGAGIALSNDGKWIYATNLANGDIRIYDTGNNAASINIPAQGARYAVTSPDGSKIYFTGSYTNTIYIIDVATNTLSATIDLTADAEGIAVSPDGNRIYVTNQSAGTVTVINAVNNSVMTTLPVGNMPEGVSVTPDGKYVYVANAGSGTLSVINTSDYTVSATIPCGIFPYAVGNFITPGINTCTGPPTDFKITVNPSPTTITPGTVGGLITTCIGAPSTSLQQFTVSGNNLSGNITATSPAGLEISFSQTSGFADVLNLTPTGGAVINKVIYVRAKASGTPAKLSGNVVLSTPGAASKNVSVKGVVNDLPTTDATNNPVYNNDDITAAIKFTGTGNTYTWANDKPTIGLAASGTGDIPSFTAVNTGIPPVVANITVTPSSDEYLYLAGANNMILVDADNNKQTGTINTGGQPIGTTVSPDGTLVAITDYNANAVKFINTTTHKVVSTVNNVSTPIGICFSPDGKKVYVVNEHTSNVTIIDVATATAEPPIYVGFSPYGIAASPDGLTVYVGSTGENAVIAINTQTHQTSQIKVNFGPTGIAVSPDNSRVYATSAQYNGSLKVINAATKTVIANIPIGDVSTGICVSPDGKRVYISNTLSNNVMVIDAELNKVIATIPTGNHPFGVSITPDGKYVYVANEGSNSVNIISTATNSIINNISVTGQLSKSFGNFFVPGTGCTGTPTKFTITVNGSAVITASAATGTISACIGSPSTSTQQFTVSGSNLSNNITVIAPTNFEVSLSQSSGFANSVIIPQTGGTVTDQVVYVRSAATAPSGNISGDIVLSSAGIADKTVAVNGVIQALPTVNQINDQNSNNAVTTTPINFTGTATTYTWANDNPAIGLPATGTGDIPSFTAINNGQTVIIATITVVPSSTSCSGNSITFKIKINPTTLTASSVSGNITACQGSPSASPDLQQFTVTGTNLTGNVQVAAPTNFEVSLSANTGYSNILTIVPASGKISNTGIYVRAAATAPAGNISGNVILSAAGLADQNIPVGGVVTALPGVNAVLLQTFDNGATTTPINFTGTATTYTWTNDNPSIGLPANGSGDIPSFTAINNGQTVTTATITVVPSNGLCDGNSTTFKININPTTLTASSASGNITACQGSPSASPDLQQFTVTGTNLKSGVQLTVPANFEVSLSQNAGYSNTLTIVPMAGKVDGAVIYVRSSASAPANNISGIITISSAGVPNQTVNVSGIVNAQPTVNPVSPLTFNNGSATTAINFTGTANIYTWTNDMPGIGLQAGGTGNIPSFTAINNLTTSVTATITVIPSNGSCTGSPAIFKITVNPTPLPGITVTGNLSSLNTVYGTPSTSSSFSVSGDNLISGVVITPPSGFEVSTDGSHFNNTVSIGGSGMLNATVVYIRLAKTTFVGNYTGNIILTTDGTSKNLAMPNSAVTPASMTITADNKTRTFHSENPPLTITYNGFVNNENESNLVKKPEVTTMATTTSVAGEYAISFTDVAESPNYSFTYVPGVLTVTPAGVVVFNTFTPNGDGINDTWAIKYIEYYPKCTVDIFNRWGARIFSSIGYGQQWDGQSSGNPVPTGTYYYVINLKDKSPVKSGWVSVVR